MNARAVRLWPTRHPFQSYIQRMKEDQRGDSHHHHFRVLGQQNSAWGWVYNLIPRLTPINNTVKFEHTHSDANVRAVRSQPTQRHAVIWTTKWRMRVRSRHHITSLNTNQQYKRTRCSSRANIHTYIQPTNKDQHRAVSVFGQQNGGWWWDYTKASYCMEHQ